MLAQLLPLRAGWGCCRCLCRCMLIGACSPAQLPPLPAALSCAGCHVHAPTNATCSRLNTAALGRPLPCPARSMVIDVAKKHFPQMAVGYSDPRVKVGI